jgi:arsenate reductase
MMPKPRILFICTHNSARSQMAEGLLRHIYGDKYEVFSAGTNPTNVNPLAIKAMAEIGIDISKHRSKSVMEFIDQSFDYVITVCGNAQKTCPVFPGEHEKIHWDLEDPAEAKEIGRAHV